MKLLITGDFFIAAPNSVLVDDSIKELFASNDYRIVNYEGPVAADHYKDLPLKSGPRLMQPSENINMLKGLGVDAITLANNHIFDQGLDGYYKTTTSLNGFKLLGVGNWEEAYRLITIEKNGLKIGVLNFCENQFGVLTDEWSQNKDAIGCAWVNHPKVNQLIVKSVKEVDYLVAIVHAGLEMIDVPLPEWRDRYREMVDLGCDAVIAHHPHIIQGYEIYNDKPICYSLGNFCFSGGVKQNTADWNVGAIAVLDFGTNGISLTMSGCQKVDGRLKLVEHGMWQQKIEQLCRYLNEDYYMGRVNDICQKMMRDYWELFAMGGLFAPEALSLKNLARLPLHKYNHVHLLNNFQCESHRWCVCRALRNEKTL